MSSVYSGRFYIIFICLATIFIIQNLNTGSQQLNPKFTFEHVFSTKPTKTKPTKTISTKLASTARLANHIFELVSFYGIAKYLHRRPILYLKDHAYKEVVENVRRVLPGLIQNFELIDGNVPINAKTVEYSKKCCVFDDPSRFLNISNDHLHLDGHFYQSHKYFDHLQNEINGFVDNKTNFGSLPKSDDHTFITCIHIRRSDFVDGEHHASQKNFTEAAVNFIENQEKSSNRNMVKVLMGDDRKFEASIFGNNNSTFVSNLSPRDDLIYSRKNCNASLITAPSSTFGWWISYLSKGQRVYYLDITTTKDVNYIKGELNPDDFFVPRWIKLKYDGNIEII